MLISIALHDNSSKLMYDVKLIYGSVLNWHTLYSKKSYTICELCMARPRGLIEVVCQNPKCDYYMEEIGKDLVKRGLDTKTGHQRYYCHHCRKFFMETKGTPLFHKHLNEQEIINICKHFVEKNGIRSIERLTGHHRDTIGKLLNDIAEQAQKMNDFLIRDVGLSTIECDEFWTFVKKNKRKLSINAQNQILSAMPGSSPV